MASTYLGRLAGSQTAQLVARLSQVSIVQWLSAIGVVIATTSISSVIYNLFVHPLRSVPGPLLWRISAVPGAYHGFLGDLHARILQLHEAYGPVVRVGPCELSFATAQGWRDIYGHRSKAAASAAGRPFHQELPRPLLWYKASMEAPNSIITADYQMHAALRSALSSGFSERSMQAQEPTLLRFVDQLVAKLRERTSRPAAAAAAKVPVNLVQWLNFTTFDIISELTYGESFHCLNSNDYHMFPRYVFSFMRDEGRMRYLRVLTGYNRLYHALYAWIIPAAVVPLHEDIARRVKNRLAMGDEREHDFVAGLVRLYKDNNITFAELCMTTNTLIMAGSETAATLLSAVTYFLLMNPDTYSRVVAEVRESFASEDEISLTTVKKLPYMLACLNEASRLHPPPPGGFPRVIPPGGDVIDGVAVPEGTRVSVGQYASNRFSSNWTDPQSYRPERWLGAPGFENDKLDAMQTFSMGPRNCIGMNLAYAEMRLILAKILYNFDLELAPESKDWPSGQKAFSVWLKPPMHVYLTSKRDQAK